MDCHEAHWQDPLPQPLEGLGRLFTWPCVFIEFAKLRFLSCSHLILLSLSALTSLHSFPQLSSGSEVLLGSLGTWLRGNVPWLRGNWCGVTLRMGLKRYVLRFTLPADCINLIGDAIQRFSNCTSRWMCPVVLAADHVVNRLEETRLGMNGDRSRFLVTLGYIGIAWCIGYIRKL